VPQRIPGAVPIRYRFFGQAGKSLPGQGGQEAGECGTAHPLTEVRASSQVCGFQIMPTAVHVGSDGKLATWECLIDDGFDGNGGGVR
jgi:hypothetical protein